MRADCREREKMGWRAGAATIRMLKRMFSRRANLLVAAHFTSPRLRGEVEIQAQLEFRVRGTLRESHCHHPRGGSPSPHPLPASGAREYPAGGPLTEIVDLPE